MYCKIVIEEFDAGINFTYKAKNISNYLFIIIFVSTWNYLIKFDTPLGNYSFPIIPVANLSFCFSPQQCILTFV